MVTNGQIYTSSDSGGLWTPRESARNWRSITSSADGIKLAAVEFGGQIFTSTDSGVTWTPRDSLRYWRAITSSADGVKLAAVDSGGQIYTSGDSGVTWIPHESFRYWYSITSSADGSKLAAGVAGGQIYTSNDSGGTWTPNDSDRTWYSITSSADGSKLVAGAFSDPILTGSVALAGVQNSSTELVYSGNGQWSVSQNNGNYVAKTGDSMSGTLNLPANGLSVGADQLLVSGGKVGINTTVVHEALTIGGNASAIELGSDVVGKEPQAGKIGYQRFTADALDIVGAGTTSSNRKIQFWNEGGANFTGPVGLPTNGLSVGTNQLVVSGGNVGIGTAAPGFTLDVSGTARVTGNLTVGSLANNTVVTAAIADINVTTAKLADGAITDAKITGPISATKLDLSTVVAKSGAAMSGALSLPANGLTVGTNQLVVSGGKVGINTTALHEALTISGNTSTIELGSDVVGKEPQAGKIGYQRFTADALDIVGAGTTGSNRKIKFWNEGGATFTGSVYSTGQVLGNNTNDIAIYGINSSIDKPSVEGWNQGTGDIFRGWSGASPVLRFYVANNGNAEFAGTVKANGSLLSSDLRLKTDIQPLENTLAKVLNLRGVSYVMKADETKERKIGVIAQELEQEFPELVNTDDKGMKSVAYANLTAVLIEAVKGLKAENEALKLRLERLEKAHSGHQ